MSEPVTKQRPTIDLDDFERRLRQSHAHDDDPLAELARLVGEQPDPYGDVFARDAGVRPIPDGHDLRDGPHLTDRPSFANFADIEAGLRGGIEPHGGAGFHADRGHVGQGRFDGQAADDADAFAVHAASRDGYAPGATIQPAPSLEEGDWAGRAAYGEIPYRANRKPIYLMAATIAIGVVGIGTAFALKSHVGTSPREVRTIMADAGPTKIQPPVEASTDQTSQDAALLGANGQATPTKLVDRQEQPVDVSQAVKENAARDAASTGNDAASVVVPPSPGQVAQADRDADAAQPSSFAADIAPKRVKVESLRPDGTPIADEAAPAAPVAAPVPAAATVAPKPTARASAKPTPKSTERVASLAPTSIAALSGASDAAAPAAKPARRSKLERVASADMGAREANDAAAPAVAASNGNFAVQLGAPRSETEAKVLSSRLDKKFAGILAGRRLGFHEAQSNGRTVYRVRVSSLSREDAVSLCEKLKADGGTCFVARN